MTDCAKFLEEKLREAASVGDIETVQRLLSSGVNVNSQNGVNGWSPLHWAAYRNYLNIVDLLVKHGADKKCLTKDGKSPDQLSTNTAIQILLAGAPSVVEEKKLPITPNYLENPPLVMPTYIIPNTHKHIQTIPGEKNSLNSNFSHHCDEELVLKVRVANLKDSDFIEVEILIRELNFKKLVETCCAELNIETDTVSKVRKLPNTIIRKDKDVFRLVNFQEIEIVVQNDSNASKPNKSLLSSKTDVTIPSRSKYQSISTNQNQVVLY